jgi:hypothetical protein
MCGGLVWVPVGEEIHPAEVAKGCCEDVRHTSGVGVASGQGTFVQCIPGGLS